MGAHVTVSCFAGIAFTEIANPADGSGFAD